jgi:5,10-methylenetetrahydromethanopterin reductase
LDDVKLDWPPAVPPLLMLGGAGPRSIELAGRLGDGTLLAGALTDQEIRSACEIALGAQSAQSAKSTQSAKPLTGPAHRVLATVIAAIGPGAQQRVDDEVPRWGKAAGLGIGVAGDAETIAESVRRLTRFGITSVCLQPTEDEPDLESFIHFLGQQVRPLL